MTICYIALGSNLNQPLQQLNAAKQAINNLAETKLLACSSIYQSQALTLDNEQQNDYLNAVLEIETELAAEPLLDALLKIETEQGRSRQKRWGARTLDLDILLYGDQCIQTKRLTVPHIELENRKFVLLPLFQIAQNISIPGERTLKELLSAISDQKIVKVSEFNG